MSEVINPVSVSSINPLSFGWACLRGDRARRTYLARWLHLPPPRYRVVVKKRLPIPMPDGVALLADHYAPTTAGTYPTVLIRSPLGRRWETLPFSFAYMFAAQRFAERGYHVLVQSARRKPLDEFLPDNEEADGLATVEWIAKQSWFNGALGLWGQSFLGFVQWAVAQHNPPFLKAMVPGLTTANFRSLFYQGDAFALENVLTVLSWLTAANRPLLQRFRSPEPTLATAYAHLPIGEADRLVTGQPIRTYREALAHPQSADPYWHGIDVRAGRRNVQASAHLISGWFDIFLPDLLDDYAALRNAGHQPHLTIGPWTHFDAAAAMTMIREGLRWFAVQLQGDEAARALPVQVYLMGAGAWRVFPAWPPPTHPRIHYLHGPGQLRPDAPQSDGAREQYVYDPAHPTPLVGGASLQMQAGQRENRELEAREDVLVYSSTPLSLAVTIMGAPRVVLYASSSAASTDFVVRLCDVSPEGRSLNVTDGLCRLPSPDMPPHVDGSGALPIDLWPTAYCFRAGHRIRLLVMSGAHPRWARNPGVDEPLATATKLVKAEQVVYHDAAHPSHLILPVCD